MATLATGSGCLLAVSAQPAYMVESAPPAERYEAVPRARVGYVWVRGAWQWQGGGNAASRQTPAPTDSTVTARRFCE